MTSQTLPSSFGNSLGTSMEALEPFNASLQEALTPVAKAIEFAFVYGSFARGEEKAKSDVDLMVAGEVTLDEHLARSHL